MAWLRLPAPPPAQGLMILTALAMVFVFYGLGRSSVINVDEALYQQIARTMYTTGHYFRLHSDNFHHVYDTFGNAPLQHWARALAISFFGDTTFAMRIFTSACALLAVLATYLAVLRIADRRAALVAGVLLVTNFQFLYLHGARTGELEPPVCLLLVVGALLFGRCIEAPERSFLPHHICLAILFNVKAPVVTVPIIAEIGCMVFLAPARARALDWLKTGLVVLPFGVSWHLYQSYRLWDRLPDILTAVRHQAETGFAARHDGLLRHASFYFARVLFGAYPYVMLFPLGLLGCVGLSMRTRSGALGAPTGSCEPPGARLRLGLAVLIAYLLGVVAFYMSISKIGPWYPVHSYPFFAACVAIWLVDLHDRDVGWSTLLELSAALCLVFFVAVPMFGYNPFETDAIRANMSVGWRHLGALPPIAALAIASLLAAGLLAAVRRASVGGAAVVVIVLALFVGVACLRASLPLAYVDHMTPLGALAADLAARREAGQPVPLPIQIDDAHPWSVHYYFGPYYEIRIVPGKADPRRPAHASFTLHPKRKRSRAGEQP